MTDNEHIREQLSAYLDGELDAETNRLIDQALAADRKLADELEQLRATRNLLRGLPKATAPEGFAARLAERAAEQQAASASASKQRRGWLGLAGAAAVLLAAIGLGVIVSQSLVSQDAADDPHGVARSNESGPADAPDATTTIAAADSNEDRRDAPDSPRRVIGKGGGHRDSDDVLAAKGSAEGGRETASKAGSDYMISSNAAGAREEALAKLTELSGGRELSIYVDDVSRNQQQVEQIMYANGIALAPDDQAVVLPSQAVNLNRNFHYNRLQNQTPQPETEEVQYLVYGDEEKLAALAEALETQVVRQQRVSQLPEPLYRQAVETPHRDMATVGASQIAWVEEAMGAKDEAEEQRRSGPSADVAAGKGASAPAAAVPEIAKAEDTPTSVGKTAETQQSPTRPSEPQPCQPQAVSAPSTTQAPAGQAETPLPLADEALFEADEKAAVQAELSDAESDHAMRRADMTQGKQAGVGMEQRGGETQRRAKALRLDALAKANLELQQELNQPRQAVRQRQADGLAHRINNRLETVPENAMVITIQRRLPVERLNALQQQNLQVLERQLQEAQTTIEADANMQTAPAEEPAAPAGQ